MLIANIIIFGKIPVCEQFMLRIIHHGANMLLPRCDPRSGREAACTEFSYSTYGHPQNIHDDIVKKL